MKQYEFHSSLTPEQVFARLAGRAKCGRDPTACDGKFRYVRRGDRFSLMYSGKRSASGFFPFQGRVEQKGDGSLISGDFGTDYGWKFWLGFGSWSFWWACPLGSPR